MRVKLLYIYITYYIYMLYIYTYDDMTSFCLGLDSWITIRSEKGTLSQDLNDSIWLLKLHLKYLRKQFIGIWHIFLYDKIKQIGVWQTVPYFPLFSCKLIKIYTIHEWVTLKLLTLIIRQITTFPLIHHP